MSIQKKLEEIREQSIHIRIRYVFFCVFLSMIGILFIWALSLKKNFENIDEIGTDPLVEKTINNPSLKDALEEVEKEKESFEQTLRMQDFPTESK